MNLLNSYWPQYEEINRCIKSQAEASSDAVLMAVHQPTSLIIREVSALTETSATEHDLLEAFLTEDLPEGALLLPVTGASGAGKSHIIRWLAAQLHRIKDERRLEVIRIPKSANLRTVVELILEPLSDDERYVSVRRKLEKVVSEVTPQDGATRFVAELKISLRNLAQQLLTQIRNDPSANDSKEKRLRLDHARRLPDFFSDAELQEYFETQVLAPIIERAIKGKNIDEEDDESLPQFSVSDLVIPESLSSGLDSASLKVQNYYKTVLGSERTKGFEVATDVLNSIIDEAIRRVFNLDQEIGGMTLQDIILHIRELLFEDKRELVLLVEDFAALPGVQEILLKVCIQEAVRDGKQVRARMRTALAVTDGYLAGRDTIYQRAKQEWVIQSVSDELNVALERTVDLVGAYLNAARWGEKQLQDKFSKCKKDDEKSLTEWVDTFEDPDKSTQEAELLPAFEFSSRGESLFPFNRAAIATMAGRHLKQSGQLIFHPRRVIDFILRKVLLQRGAFEESRFPPIGFEGANPSADVASWLAHANLTDEIRGRLKSLIVFWGGHPQTPEQAATISPELFKTFGLPTPEDLGQERGEQTELQPADQPEEQLKPEVVIERSIVDEWRDKLDRWSEGVELKQQDANKLRKLITNSIERYIDWNGLCMAPRSFKLLLVIPNARGNDAAAKYRLDLASDHTDPSGILRRTLLAAVRYELAGNSWDYDDGDQDSALFANMIDRLGSRLQSLLSDERDKEIVPVASVLIRQGRVLGMLPKTSKYPDMRASVIVDEPPQLEATSFLQESVQGKWVALQQEASQLRGAFRDEIFSRIGCFQGTTGKTPYAIDVTKIPRDENEEDEVQTDLSQELRAHILKLSPRRLAPRTRPLIESVRAFYSLVANVLGDDLDKNTLIAVFKELLEALELAGVWPEIEVGKRKLRNEIEAFRLTPLKDLLDQIAPLLDTKLDPTEDIAINCLGRINLATLDQSQAFLDIAEQFTKAAEQLIAIESLSFKGINPEETARSIERKLKLVGENLNEISNEGTEP